MECAVKCCINSLLGTLSLAAQPTQSWLYRAYNLSPSSPASLSPSPSLSIYINIYRYKVYIHRVQWPFSQRFELGPRKRPQTPSVWEWEWAVFLRCVENGLNPRDISLRAGLYGHVFIPCFSLRLPYLESSANALSASVSHCLFLSSSPSDSGHRGICSRSDKVPSHEEMFLHDCEKGHFPKAVSTLYPMALSTRAPPCSRQNSQSGSCPNMATSSSPGV